MISIPSTPSRQLYTRHIQKNITQQLAMYINDSDEFCFCSFCVLIGHTQHDCSNHTLKLDSSRNHGFCCALVLSTNLCLRKINECSPGAVLFWTLQPIIYHFIILYCTLILEEIPALLGSASPIQFCQEKKNNYLVRM